MRKFLIPERIMYFFGASVLCIAIVMNITTQIPFVSLLPATQWIEIAVNTICVIFCIIFMIHPNYSVLLYILFFVEAGVTVHIGFIGIGMLPFAAGCAFAFVNGEFMTNRRQNIRGLVSYWTIIVIGTYFAFGIKFFLFEAALTLLYFGLAVCLYKKVESSLSYFLHSSDMVCPKINLPPRGTVLKLSDYGLTERQIVFVLGSIKNGETYEALAIRCHMSISVVKKDMAAVCKIFDVTNREALRLLFLRYTICTE